MFKNGMSKISNLYWSIWRFFKWKFPYLHKDIINGIKNIIKWMPIVWEDRDWDHAYIMDPLRFKIKNTADYIEKHKRYEGWERDVERMRLCVRLFDALEKDIYESEYHDYYETTSLTDEEGYYKSTPIRDDLDSYLKKYPNYYRRLSDKDKERKVWSAIMIGHARHNRASNLLFELIKRNIYKWWD
jgi:hypothetical protein